MHPKYPHHKDLTRKYTREVGGITALARLLHLNQSTVQEWADGKRRVPPLQAMKIGKLSDGKYSFDLFYPDALDIPGDAC